MRFDSRAGSAVAALFFLAALACSGGGDAPAGGSDAVSTVRAFYEHLNSGRYGDAKALYTDEVRDQIFPDAEADEGFRNWAVVETHNQSMTGLNVLSESEGETGVTIEFELRFSNGESAQRKVTVSEHDGGWRLGFIG